MPRSATLVAVGALVAAVAVIWITATGRWHGAAWAAPGPISGDVLEVGARIRAAHENWMTPWDLYGRLDRLGAPVDADWSGYPISDRPEFWAAGLLEPLAGPLGTINWLMLFGYAAGAVSFFLCARFLRWSTPWAFAGALVFAFANFNFRWAPSLSLGLTFTLPPACLLFQWIARPAPPVRTRGWRLLAVGLGLAFGVGNPYFVLLAVQLALWSMLLQLGRGAQRERLRVAGWFLGALVAGSLLTIGPWFLGRLHADQPAQAIVRNYAGTELYALKAVELFMPPYNHQIAPLARFGTAYERLTMLHGEPWSPYLGVISGLSFVALLATAAWRAIGTRRRRRIPDAALASGWVLLYSSVGGVNSLLGLAGLEIFRASNRYSIFLLVWALFFGLGRLQRRFRPLKSAAWIPALVLVAVAVVDQMPAALPAAVYQTAAATLAADRATAGRLASATAPDAAIFQLPAVPFPEVPPRLGFTDYQHFRLYLADPSLRLSYGGLRGSLADNWGEMTAALPAPKMVAELEAAGFAALVVDRRAYADNAESLVQSFDALHLPHLALPESPHLVAFRLHPAPHPVIPQTDDPRFLPTWSDARPSTAQDPALYADHGWYGSERDGDHQWRWAGDQAVVALWQAEGRPATAVLSASVSSLSSGHLIVRLNGRVVWEGNLSTSPTAIDALALPLRTGANRVQFDFGGRLRSPPGDKRQLGFKVSDLSVSYGR